MLRKSNAKRMGVIVIHTGTAPVPPQESLRSSCPALPAQGPEHRAGAPRSCRHTSPALP